MSKKVRKSKTKMMIEAVEVGVAEKGNHKITFEADTFTFWYRGTPIYTWNAKARFGENLYAGGFEETASTRNQRKTIWEAIVEFEQLGGAGE
jgi:hypothetical protein